jgi:hypothetical protein
MKKPLEFISVRNLETERTSSISIGGRLDNPPGLCIVGVLNHNDRIVPNSTQDADRLIAWLQEWKASQANKPALDNPHQS